jgi:hypothetical protein
MKLVAVGVVCGLLGHAQAESCHEQRSRQQRAALAEPDIHVRTKLLVALPDCDAPPPQSHALPRAWTFELAVGGGAIEDPHARMQLLSEDRVPRTRYMSVGGPSFGAGTFVTRDLALTLRVAGSMLVGNGVVYVGNVGPNAQYWFNDHVWAGGGLGFAIVSGCQLSCGEFANVGVDARAGYALDRRDAPGVTVELASWGLPAASSSITTLALMASFQR